MDADLFRRAGDLFDDALERPRDQRQEFLAQACDGNDELRRQVERLIDHDRQTTGLLDRPAVSMTGDDASADLAAGTRLGNYRVAGEIGRGGMGVVYRATRDDDEFQRQVAIKVVRDGGLRARDAWRFHRERQILARLEHANIARLYDGGTTSNGQPFLVLEYVDGLPLTTYCDRHQLPVSARLELIVKVCSAVQFAHRNLVVHRDLKPSNILVDSEGEPKLLDFGIAKLLATEPETENYQATQDHQRIMTLSHASPEQVMGYPITTASDVYCLGLVLYELLCGVSPFAETGSTPHELLRRIHDDSPHPSQTLGRRRSEDGPDPVEVATHRSTSVAGLRKILRGDLDTVTQKALRKEPEQRYATANELAEDVLRYLANRPILAGSPGATYRLGKFLRRHRAPVTVAAVALFAIIGLLGAFVNSQVQHAQRMERERDKVTRAMDFLVEIFEVSNPGAPMAAATPARQLLDRAARRATLELPNEPEVQATLLHTLGRVYSNLGLVDTAEDMLRRALELRRLDPQGNAELARTLEHLASTVALRNRDEEAIALFDDSLNLAEQTHGPGHPRVSEVLLSKAGWLAQTQRFEDAEQLARRAIAGYAEHPDYGLELARSREQLSTILQRTGEWQEAKLLAEQALAGRQAIYGEDHPLVAASLETLGGILRIEGQLEKSVELTREALKMRRRISAPTDTELLITLHNLALALAETGQSEEAEELLREELDRLEEMFPGADHFGKGSALFNLSGLLAERGKLPEALELAQRDLEMRRRLLGDPHPRSAPSWLNVGRVQRQIGQLPAAEQTLRRALGYFEATRKPGHPGRPVPKYELGATLTALGRLGEAETLLREALSDLEPAVPPNHPRRASAELHLGACLAAQQRWAEAEPLLKSAYESLSSRGDAVPGLHQVKAELSALYRAWGRPEEARAYDSE